MLNVGRRARQSVMAVYELLGGDEGMKTWAQANKTDFYTKLFGKMISKEVELKADDSVEELLDRLDSMRNGGGAIEAHIVDTQSWPVPSTEGREPPIVVGDVDDDVDNDE